MRLQQGVLSGVPTTRWTTPFNKSAQAANFRVSLGQLTGLVDGTGNFGDGLIFGGIYVGGRIGFVGFGDGVQVLQEVTKVKKSRFRETMRTVDAKAAISQNVDCYKLMTSSMSD